LRPIPTATASLSTSARVSTPPQTLDIEGALAYVRKHSLDACAIEQAGRLVGEAYSADFSANQPHPLYSGSKSFWGPLALRAQQDGVLQLDEPVCETIHEWRDDADKKAVTIRMLLSLTAGYGFGGLGNAVPTYDRAISIPLKDKPGTKFTYGGIALQVFGALLARKLAPRQVTPHEYLMRQLLAPAGVSLASWRTLKDGTHPLPTGAFLSARDWLAYGNYVLEKYQEFAECFRGSQANPRYGLGWWLRASGAPLDLVYASGSGGQALYVVRSAALAIVHFGNGGSYKHESFLRQLFKR